MDTYNQRIARVERPISQAAVWCQRLALFVIPYLMIVILGHRFALISTVETFLLLALGILLLLAVLVFGVRGFYQVWHFGHKGGLMGVQGCGLALLLLAPFAYYALMAFVLPPLHDVSTDLDDAPAFEAVLSDRTGGMNPIMEINEEARAMHIQFYPKVTARRYGLPVGQVFNTVVELVIERDWLILTDRNPQGQAPIDAEGSALLADKKVDDKGFPLNPTIPHHRPLSRVVPPQSGQEENEAVEETEERYVEAVAKSFIFGFESDVVIRLTETEEGTLVDMRSSSRWGSHDLGSNAKRILNFMEDLDLSLQNARGQNL